MALLLKIVRILGVAFALVMLFFFSRLLLANLHSYGFTTRFIWRQLVAIYLPYFSLLFLLLVPFSRIKSFTVWRLLLIAMAVLTLWWFVPVAYRNITSPPHRVVKPPGEGVALKINISRSYDELIAISFVLGFLVMQMFAIWYERQRTSSLTETHSV